MYLFSNIIGVFVFDEQIKVVEEISFKNPDDYKDKEGSIQKIKNRGFLNLKEPDEEEFKKILLYFKNPRFFSEFYNKNLQLTKFDLKNSVRDDILLIQSIKTIEEIDRTANLLSKRLREWYEIYNPEFSRATESHENFVESIIEKEKPELLDDLKISMADSIGADLKKADLEPMTSLARQISNLYKLRKSQLDYISALMDSLCPNIMAVCGAFIAAKLIEHAGSLKRLSEMPASTIQVLGAETALFRHIKTGAKPPKHGVIANHILIAKAADKMRGKIARTLADKITIAAKVDYFKGKFIGDKLKEELEKKFKTLF